LLGSAGGKEGQQLARHGISARKLLAQHHLGLAHHLGASHILITYFGHDSRRRAADTCAATAGNEINQHGGANDE
jgi:hypothetical protein